MKHRWIERLAVLIYIYLYLYSACSIARNMQTTLFEIQPYFYHQSFLEKFIDPTQMAAIQIGKSIAKKYHQKATSIITLYEIKHLKEIKNVNYDIKLEVPYYNSQNSVGILYSNESDRLLGITPIGSNQMPPYQTQDNQFMDFTARHILLIFTKRMTFLIHRVPCALTLTPQAGFTYMPQATTYENKYYPVCLGCVGGSGVGFECYLNQWCGIYLDYSLKAHWVSSSILASEVKEKSLQYYTSALTVGLRITFQPEILAN